MKKVGMGIIALLILLPITQVEAKKFKYFTNWTFTTPFAKVFDVATKLPKSLPLKKVKFDKKGKLIVFNSDWGTMDIPKDVTLRFTPEGKNTTVDVDGAPATQAYQILKAIGDALKQPLPEPPRRHR